MPAAVKIRTDFTAGELRRLAAATKNANQSRRLLSIAAVLDGMNRTDAARIGGKQMYLWRAVDAEGEVLDVLLQAKRDTKAARKLMRKLLKKQGVMPDEWITDKNPAYGAALRELRLTRVAHTRRKRANNRVESSHVPVRRRERKLQRFKSPRSAQRFLSLHTATYNVFTVPRHVVSHAPPLSSRGVRGVEERGRCCRLTWTSGQLIVPAFNNVTTPTSLRFS